MQRYSTLNFVWQALRDNRHWQPARRDTKPKRAYDVAVIGDDGTVFRTRTLERAVVPRSS
jgi:hypothetical protein